MVVDVIVRRRLQLPRRVAQGGLTNASMRTANFSERATTTELVDDLSIDDPALRKNLRELEALNRWLGGRTTLLCALNKVFCKYSASFKDKTITVVDVGCGGGDLIRTVHAWAKAKKFSVKLIGIDANPFMIRYAETQIQTDSTTKFVTLNVFSDAFKAMRFDVACLNLFCHHLDDPQLVAMLQQLHKQASAAVIINDLHRHWLAYVSIEWMARLFGFTHLARHDGPLSVLRAFRKTELVRLLKMAKIDSYEIHWHWAFRWETILWT
jgi:2-polyprenyl-3-methyl-5-hydroxy-6-metoxy-1,4-benzoquinol methylase